MAQSKKVEHPVSAGGVVYKLDKGKVEVVICGRASPATWNLPKGTPDAGESIEETALREVNEETGLEVDLEEYIGSINYWFVLAADRVRCHKTVHFYLMISKGGLTSNHDPEFDRIEWVSAKKAIELLTHENEARIVEQALSLVAEKSRKE